VKSGYPPQSLTIVPELPLSSLGLKQGDQIIVSQKAGAVDRALPKPKLATSPPTRTSVSASAPGSSLSAGLSSGVPSNAAAQTKEPDSVATDGGFLIHRVS
jgi:ubiquitin thioesterase OTU1